MLDPNYFTITAGQSNVKDLNITIQKSIDSGLSLPTIQEQLFEQGWRGAELAKTVNGWVLRSDTGLNNFKTLAGSGKGWTYEEALEASKRWFCGDATRRYVFVRRIHEAEMGM